MSVTDLEAALAQASDRLDGWATAVLRAASRKPLPFDGPSDPEYVFVGHQPTPEESAAGVPLIGEDGEIFDRAYLSSLGVRRDQVAVGYMVPVSDSVGETQQSQWISSAASLVKSLRGGRMARVVALGRFASKALGDIPHETVPHPAVLRTKGDSGEVGRKTRRLAKLRFLDNSSRAHILNAADSKPDRADANGSKPWELKISQVHERKNGHRQVISCIALNPNRIDHHGSWWPADVVESAAHLYLEHSRTVSYEHGPEADAVLVESFVEKYPSIEDYEAAHNREDHSVSAREWGSDVIMSGCWAADFRLGDELWGKAVSGEIDGISVGAMTVQESVDSTKLPKINVKRLAYA